VKRTGWAALGAVFVAACATTDAGLDPVLYEAQGDGWELRITTDSVRLRERVGRETLEYNGSTPALLSEGADLRIEGELLRLYVIAGLVEEDTRRYAVEIAARACRDPSGRLWPTTVRLNFFSEYAPTACDEGTTPGPLGMTAPPFHCGGFAVTLLF